MLPNNQNSILDLHNSPALDEAWKKVKLDTQRRIKNSLSKVAGPHGCIAGCARPLIHLIAETEFIDRVIKTIRQDFEHLILDSSPHSTTLTHTPPARATSTLWTNPSTAISHPLSWFDLPREIYVSFPFYKCETTNKASSSSSSLLTKEPPIRLTAPKLSATIKSATKNGPTLPAKKPELKPPPLLPKKKAVL